MGQASKPIETYGAQLVEVKVECLELKETVWC